MYNIQIQKKMSFIQDDSCEMSSMEYHKMLFEELTPTIWNLREILN